MKLVQKRFIKRNLLLAVSAVLAFILLASCLVLTGVNTATAAQNEEVSSVVLQVNPGYTHKGDYWYDGDRSVFVRNMSRADFLKGLELIVNYGDEERTLDLTKLPSSESEKTYRYDTGETVTVSDFDSAQTSVDFTVNVSIGSNIYTASVTVYFEESRIASLAIKEEYLNEDGSYNYGGTLKSGTPSNTVLADLFGKVNAIYNSGESSPLNETAYASLTISEPALTPTAEDIDKTTYLKTLTLVYTGHDSSGNEYTVSSQFKVSVEYEEPEVSNRFNGSLGAQTYRRPIDFSGINVQVAYG